MPIMYGSNDYWKLVNEIKAWEAELQHGINTKAERREMCVIIAELKNALERDVYGKF